MHSWPALVSFILRRATGSSKVSSVHAAIQGEAKAASHQEEIKGPQDERFGPLDSGMGISRATDAYDGPLEFDALSPSLT